VTRPTTDNTRYRLQGITDTGRKALRDDTQMDDEDRLILEVMARVDGIDEANYEQLYIELMNAFGTAAAAVEAIKRGGAHFYLNDDPE
jgi:translation initiation factor 2 alpha subunit (eIF-2alpha)